MKNRYNISSYISFLSLFASLLLFSCSGGDVVESVREEILFTPPPANVSKPEFSLSTGVYDHDINVIITCTTGGVTIYYTTDGTEPDINSISYNGNPLVISGHGTHVIIRAIAVKQSVSSEIGSADYTINYNQVSTPQFNPPSGSYYHDLIVEIESPTPDAEIHYTVDGTEPDFASPEYSTPISIDGNGTSVTVKAVAYKDGMLASTSASSSYAIAYFKTSAPMFSPLEGVFTSPQYVTITSITEGSQIRYTTDGSSPSPTYGSIYAGPIYVTHPQLFKAIAYRADLSPSDVVQYSCRIAVDTVGDVGHYGSIATSGTTVIIGYMDYTNSYPKIARSVDCGTTWTTKIIDTVFTSFGPSVTFGNSKFHMSYLDGVNTHLKYMSSSNGGESWTSKIIYTSGFGLNYNTIIRSVGSNISISFQEQVYYTNGTKFANSSNGGVSWIVGSNSEGSYPYHAMDYNSYGSFYSGTTYGGADSTYILSGVSGVIINNNWDYAASVGPSSDHVSYCSNGLKYSRSTDGSNWTHATIDSSTSSHYTSIASSGDNVYIAYSKGNLCLAKSSDAGLTWTLKTVDRTIASAYDTAIAVDGNNVYISYYDSVKGDLYFIKSTDGGLSW